MINWKSGFIIFLDLICKLQFNILLKGTSTNINNNDTESPSTRSYIISILTIFVSGKMEPTDVIIVLIGRRVNCFFRLGILKSKTVRNKSIQIFFYSSGDKDCTLTSAKALKSCKHKRNVADFVDYESVKSFKKKIQWCFIFQTLVLKKELTAKKNLQTV